MANMYRFIDNKLFILPNILDINKKYAFKDPNLRYEIDIIANNIDWKFYKYLLDSFNLKI
jgi:hypothetical protein